MKFLLKLLTWWNGPTIGTELFTWRFGKRVGEDAAGNVYYQNADGSRRWVIFKGEPEASEQAAQVELAFELHVLDHLVVGKIGDADLDAAGQSPELSRQCRVGGGGQLLEIVEIGRLGVRPIGSGGTAAE